MIAVRGRRGTFAVAFWALAISCGGSTPHGDDAAPDAAQERPPEASADTPLPDSGDADAVTDAAPDTATDTAADATVNDTDASCTNACAPAQHATFCNANEVQWDCFGSGFDHKPFIAHCRDAATNLVRYCCPAAFNPRCD